MRHDSGRASRWVFVRHAQSVANAEGWLAGRTDAPLSAHGLEQARALGEQLAAVPMQRCVSSTSVRAVATAEALVAGRAIPWVKTDDLCERFLGECEGASRERLRATPIWHQILLWNGRPPGGESLRDVARRVVGYLAGLEPTTGTTLVVAHASVLKVVWGLLGGVNPAAMGRMQIRNAVPFVREVSPHAWQLLCQAVNQE